MGGKNSTLQKFSAQDRFRRRWNYEGETQNITPTQYGVPNMQTGDMDTPVYRDQSEPDRYINACESDHIDNDSVWLPQNSNSYLYLTSRETTVYGELYEETPEIVIRETVFDGPDDIYEDPDIYSADDDSEYTISNAASETNIKQLAVLDDTTQAKKYLEFDTTADRQQRRLHRYEEMVIIFEPLIVRNVIARHLIPHLTFLEDPGKVQAIADRNPRSAVLYIIDELKNNHVETGRWKQFIEALERCEYRYIVSILRGEKPVDHSYQREYLRIITPALRTTISPIELTEVLWSVDVISEDDKEEIQQMHNNFGPLAATDRLLDRVPTKHKYWYSHLIDGLRRIQMEHAADMLDIPELRKLSDYSDDTDDYIEPLRVQPNQIETRTDNCLVSTEKLDDAQTFVKKQGGDEEADLDMELYEDPTAVTKRQHSAPEIIYMRKMPAMSVYSHQNGGNVKEEMVYEEYSTMDECAEYRLPPPPSFTQLSSRTYKADDDATPDNSRCKTLTSILTQQDGQTATPVQPNTHCTRPPGSRYVNTHIEAEMETRQPAPIPQRSYRQLHSPPTRKKLPLPSAQTSKCEQHNEGCTNNLNADAMTLSQPQTLPKHLGQENLLRTISIEEDSSDVEVVVLEYPPRRTNTSPPFPEPNSGFPVEVVVLECPPRITNASPPFPEPNCDFPNQARIKRLPPSKPFCKRPMPLPRQKTLSTEIHKAMKTSNKCLSDTYYDDAYTAVDDKSSPVIDDDGYEDDTDESERMKFDEKKPVDRNKVMFGAPKEHEIANRRVRGKKLGISKPPSQKKKMRRKRLAKSRKNAGGNIFRNLFHRKKLDKQTNADEEEKTSEKEKCAVQLNKNRPAKSKRSRSLPTEIEKALESMDLYYSQPFRDERRKPETTSSEPPLIVHKPSNRDSNAVTKVKENLHTFDRKKELMEIFNTCSKRHGIDQERIKSDIIAQELTQENIHPDVEILLEDVRQQHEELMVLVYQEPVMKMKLEKQTHINEKLKHLSALEGLCDMKTKEASALKEARQNPSYQSNSETNYPGLMQTYDTHVSSAREMSVQETFTKKHDSTFTGKSAGLSKEERDSLCTEERDSTFTKKPENIFTEERDGIFTGERNGIFQEKHDVVSTVIEEHAHIVNKADETFYDKDSAFYSYTVRL